MKSSRKPDGDYTLQVALAGDAVAKAADTLLRTLRGGIDAGQITLSGTGDMAEFARKALVDLQQAVLVFKDVTKGPA